MVGTPALGGGLTCPWGEGGATALPPPATDVTSVCSVAPAAALTTTVSPTAASTTVLATPPP